MTILHCPQRHFYDGGYNSFPQLICTSPLLSYPWIFFSCPHKLQKGVRLRTSKFGRALVVETFAKAGGYILGKFFLITICNVLHEMVNIRGRHWDLFYFVFTTGGDYDYIIDTYILSTTELHYEIIFPCEDRIRVMS